jgi:phage FluMu protein Com
MIIIQRQQPKKIRALTNAEFSAYMKKLCKTKEINFVVIAATAAPKPR